MSELKLDRNLCNHRPDRRTSAALSKSDRMSRAVRGAQWSPSMEQWVGFLFDGLNVTLFEGRTTRERALKDAHAHYDRIFHEERAVKRWVR